MSNCTCKPGMERDNCPACEGTGKRIDFSSNHICPKCGKRGDGITYKHKKYGCDDNYIDTDRNLMMPTAQFKHWQEANKSEPMGAFDTAWALLKNDWSVENDDEYHITISPQKEGKLNDMMGSALNNLSCHEAKMYYIEELKYAVKNPQYRQELINEAMEMNCESFEMHMEELVSRSPLNPTVGRIGKKALEIINKGRGLNDRI